MSRESETLKKIEAIRTMAKETELYSKRDLWNTGLLIEIAKSLAVIADCMKGESDEKV